MNGILCLAVGAATPILVLPASGLKWMVRGFITTAWGNFMGYALGATIGVRGLIPVCMSKQFPYLFCPTDAPSHVNVFPNACFVLAILGLVIGLYQLLRGSSAAAAGKD
mmetsp:Transcript_35925/g.83434  ORF Transcript_35925/g.83434 Transcript_35925/m.83434 type:complete len:109 (-) Transcript_35925:152-478(-)